MLELRRPADERRRFRTDDFAKTCKHPLYAEQSMPRQKLQQ